jgi:Surface adhesin CshA non-repetitive domain 2
MRLILWALAFFCAIATQAFAATCAPAGSQGAAPPAWQTYCWIDMTSYNNAAVFGGGQGFSITLSDGSVLSFTLSGSSPGTTAITAVAAPAWSGAATGNSAFLGIPGKPILYTTTGGTVNLTLSNIQVTPPNGVVSTGQYKFVVADAESTNGSESLTFTTNGGAWTLVDQVPPTTGSNYPTAAGTGTATFTTTGVAGSVGAYIMGSLSPSTVNVQLVAGGLQGVMLAVQYSTITANKQISGGRANPADQFTYSVIATSNGSTLSAATSTGAGNGPFGAAVATLSSSVSTTVREQMAAGSVSNLAQYTTNLNCVNGATGSPTAVPTNQPVTSFNFGSTAYGDSIACTFTNTAKTATVALQKITAGAIGGPFTFAVTNLASAPAAITTTATNTATPASPTAINVTAFNTAVTITETAATNFTATAATCTDANSAITGNPASFGTLAGNVLTIPAANVLAAAKITCTITNTVNTANAATVALQKTTLGSAGGAFTFTSTNLASTPTPITTASAGTPYPTVTTPILASANGTAVTITETVATNFTITSASCLDGNAAASGNPVGTFGTLAGTVLTIPATNVRARAQITCTFTNIVNPAIPLVAIQKITTGLPGGPFSFTATNLAGTPANITTTAASTAAPVVPNYISVTSILNPVTLTEAANSNFNLSTGTCTDTNAATSGNPASFGTLAGSVITIPVTNLKPFAKIVCTYTNAPKAPTLALQKITSGSFGGPFTFTATNLASVPANITTTVANTAAPVAPTPIQITTANAQVQITEGANTSFTATSATCSDANASFTGNPASFGSLAGSVLTVPAVNVLPAAQITCTITNTTRPATVAIRKTTTNTVGGPFNFSVANLASAPAAITTTAAGTPAPAAPTAINVSTLNSVVQMSEGANAFFTLSGASCTDANSAVTGNPASFGTLVGQLLTIPATNVLPAAQITCTFTNVGIAPKIRLQKALAASGRLAAADQFRLAVTGTGAPAAVNTTGAAAAITSAAISFTATANTAYSLTETMAAGSTSLITAYVQSVACTNNNATGTNVSGLATIPINFTIQAADDISCVITNNGTPTPNLAISKTYSTATTPVVLGQIITYTYTIANTGNVTINNVQIADMHGTPPVQIATGGTGIKGDTLTVPGPLGAAASPDTTANDGIWSTLAPGATVQFTYTHIVTQAEIDHG